MVQVKPEPLPRGGEDKEEGSGRLMLCGQSWKIA